MEPFHVADCGEVFGVESGIRGAEILDCSVPCCHIGLFGDFSVFDREEFSRVKLHLLPRRIPEHHVESSFLHDFREGEIPVEEAVPVGKFPGLLCNSPALRNTDFEAIEVFGKGSPGAASLVFGREVCSDEEIGAQLFSYSCLVPARSVPSGGFAFDVVERILRHGIDVGGGKRHFEHTVFVEQAAQHGVARLAVSLLERSADGFVVARQVLERLAGYAASDHVRIE